MRVILLGLLLIGFLVSSGCQAQDPGPVVRGMQSAWGNELKRHDELRMTLARYMTMERTRWPTYRDKELVYQDKFAAEVSETTGGTH